MLAWLITTRSQVQILLPLLAMMFCAYCLHEVQVPSCAAWPQRCPKCLSAPFALVSTDERTNGMEPQGPGRKVAWPIQDGSAGRGSRVGFFGTTGVSLG